MWIPFIHFTYFLMGESREISVCVYMLCIDFQNMHSTSKVKTVLGREAILSGPYNFKALFDRLNAPS